MNPASSSSRPAAKSRLNYVLHASEPDIQPTHQPNSNVSSPTPSTRLQALTLGDATPDRTLTPDATSPSYRLPPLMSAFPPPLQPTQRARSADSGIMAVPHAPHPSAPPAPPGQYASMSPPTRSDSGFSDVTVGGARAPTCVTHPPRHRGTNLRDAASFSSGPSFTSLAGSASTATPPASLGGPPHPIGALGMMGMLPRRAGKSESDLRDKREMRRMKNRISAARSRQRKTDTFETLQRELAEAKNVIDALTHQLAGGGRDVAAGAPPPPHAIAVPHDLRPLIGRDFVSVDVLMDMLRAYIRRAPP